MTIPEHRIRRAARVLGLVPVERGRFTKVQADLIEKWRTENEAAIAAEDRRYSEGRG